jgi:hypothetical protein
LPLRLRLETLRRLWRWLLLLVGTLRRLLTARVSEYYRYNRSGRVLLDPASLVIGRAQSATALKAK